MQQFDDIFRVHKDRIYRLCSVMTYDKALTDDLFQEASVNIWKGLRRFRGDAKIETWLYRVIVNTATTFNARQRRNQEKQQALTTQSKGRQSKQFERNSTEVLLLAISRLAEADRVLIGLHLEGYAYREIAEILAMTTSNVGVRLSRIKSKLKQIMQPKSMSNGRI